MKTLKYEATFWEEYGGTIKQCGMVVLGIATAALTGSTASLGAAMGGKTGNEMAENHQINVKIERERFEDIKNAIVALRW